jgi:hypothetical protein
MDAVGADHELIAAEVCCACGFSERNHSRRKAAVKHVQQMRAVHERPLGELAALVKRTIVAGREQPTAPVARLARQVGPGIAPHFFGKAVALQDAHRIGVHDDARTHRVELRRPFQDARCHAADGKLARDRQSPDAAADDQHRLHQSMRQK